MELDEFKKKYKIHGNVDKFLKKYRNIVDENSESIRKNVKNFSIPQLNATLFILRAKGGKDEFIDTFSDVIGLVCMKNPSTAAEILDNTKIISPEQKQQILDSSKIYEELLDEYKNSIAEVTKTEIALKNAKEERDKVRIKSSKLALAKNEDTFEEYRRKVDDLFGTDFENELRNTEIDKVNAMDFSTEEINNAVPTVEEYSFEEPAVKENQYEQVQQDEDNDIFENANNEVNPFAGYENTESQSEPIVEEVSKPIEEPISEEYVEPQEVEEYSYEEPVVEDKKPIVEKVEVEEKPTKIEPSVKIEVPESHLLFCTISGTEFKEFNNTERKKKKYANISEDEMQEKYYNDETKKNKNSKAQFDYDQKVNAIAVYLDEAKRDEVHAYCEYKADTGFEIFAKRISKENKELPIELIEAMYYVQERDKQFTPNRSEDYTTEAKLAFERDIAAILASNPEVKEAVIKQKLPESYSLFCAISGTEFKEFNNTERKKKKYANISEDEMQEKYYNDETKKNKNSKAQFDYDQKINAIAVYLDEAKRDEVHAYCEYKINTGFEIFSKRISKENKELPIELIEAMYYVQERDKQFTPNRSEDYTTEAKLAFERDLTAALTPKSEKVEEPEIEEYVEPAVEETIEETPIVEEIEETPAEEYIEPVEEEYIPAIDDDINLGEMQEYSAEESETIADNTIPVEEPISEEYVEPQEVEEYSYEEPVEEYSAPVEETPTVEEIKEEKIEPIEEEYVPFMPESYAKAPDYVEFANNNDKAFVDFIKMTNFKTTEDAQKAFYGAYLRLRAENTKVNDKKIIKQILKDTKASLEFDQDNPFDNEKADVKGKIISKINIEPEEDIQPETIEEPIEEPIVEPINEEKVDEKIAEEVSDDDLLAILEGSKTVEDLYPDMATDDLLDAVMNGTLNLDDETK